MRPRSLMALIAAALAVLAVPGCGSSTLDSAKIEDEVEKLARERDLAVEDVDCPDDVKTEAGRRFTCETDVRGDMAVEAEVEQTTDDGDVRVRLRVRQAVERESPREAQLVAEAIRSFVTAARAGDERAFCGQQSDARLKRRYGGIRACVRSKEARTPARGIPHGDSVAIDIRELDPPAATVRVGSPGSLYEMVDEGGRGGWAVDAIDGE